MNKTILIEGDLKNDDESKVIRLGQKVEKAIKKANKDGYKVISVTGLNGSDSDFSEYGFSYTAGVLIVFEKV